MAVKMKLKTMSSAACALAAQIMVTLGALAGVQLQRFAYEKAEMGLPFSVTLHAPDEGTAKAAADAAFARVAELNAVFSDYDPESELSRLSRTQGVWVPVTTELWRVLDHAQKLSEK